MTVKWIPPAGLVPKYISNGGWVNAATTALALPLPTGAGINCYIAVIGQNGNASPFVTPPAGWVLLAIAENAAGTGLRVFVANTSISGTQTFTTQGSGTSGGIILGITGTPDAAPGTATNNFGTTLQAPNGTLFGNPTFVIEIWMALTGNAVPTISTNVNNPTTLFAANELFGAQNTGILIVAFATKSGLTSTTGDTMNDGGVNAELSSVTMTATA